jgi:hypothetical protein
MDRIDPWQEFGLALNAYRESLRPLRQYSGAYKPPTDGKPWYFQAVPEGALALSDTQSLLSTAAIGPSHGFDLLAPIPLPQFPTFPVQLRPPGIPPNWAWSIEETDELEKEGRDLCTRLEDQFDKETSELASLRRACEANDLEAISKLMRLSHVRHRLPTSLAQPFEVDIDPTVRIVLCTIEAPDLAGLSIVKQRASSFNVKWTPVTATERRLAVETIFYSLCLRAAYLVANSDAGNWFDTVAVNARQNWSDPATGAPREAPDWAEARPSGSPAGIKVR